MADIVALKDYLKKLQKIINFKVTFTFSHWQLVKKTRKDDIMCCIYATLPDTYKRMRKTQTSIQRYNSVFDYGLLTTLIAITFFLDKNLFIVNITEVNKLINGIIMTIEQDIHSIQQALE